MANRIGRWKMFKILVLATMLITVGTPKQILAEEASSLISPETEEAQNRPEPEVPTGPEQEAISEAPLQETLPVSETTNRSTGASAHERSSDSVLSVDRYELYAPGDPSATLSSLRKGKQAKMVVYVSAKGMATKDVGKSNISVSKLSDSFTTSGTPKIKVISDKEDDLEFTITFSKLTYRGKGNILKFRTNFKKTGISPQIQEIPIWECEESSSGNGRTSDDINGQPVIKIRRTAPETAVSPGEHFSLELELENTSSDSDIEDLVVSMTPGNSVFIAEDTNSRLIGNLDSRKKTAIKLNLIAGTEISGPSQIIDLDLKYNYYSGGSLTPGTSSQKVLLPVKGGSATGQPVIRVSRSGLEKPVAAGETFQMVITLQNTSSNKDIRNLYAVFEPNDQISLLEETDTRQLGELKAGQSIEAILRLKAGSELSTAASQLLGMTLKFDYDSDKGPVQGTYSERIVIPTSGRGKGPGNPTPNVIVKNYSYGDRVTAGTVFDLEMEFGNTSSSASVENLVLSLDTGEGISINSSSNTFYIPKLGPGESQRENVQVQALFQSKLQSPKITISCKYEYLDRDERKQSSSSETIAIPVYQPDRFQIGSPSFSEEFRQGEEATISIPYVNKGRGQVYNVEARLEGEIDALTKELNLGNFESGKSGTIDFIVTPSKKGDFQGKVIITYEDETAEIKSAEVPLSFQVKEGNSDPSDLLNDIELKQPDKGGISMKWIAFTAAFVFLIGAAAYQIRKKKSSRSSNHKDWEQSDSWDESDNWDESDGWDGSDEEKDPVYEDGDQ